MGDDINRKLRVLKRDFVILEIKMGEEEVVDLENNAIED